MNSQTAKIALRLEIYQPEAPAPELYEGDSNPPEELEFLIWQQAQDACVPVRHLYRRRVQDALRPVAEFTIDLSRHPDDRGAWEAENLFFGERITPDDQEEREEKQYSRPVKRWIRELIQSDRVLRHCQIIY